MTGNDIRQKFLDFFQSKGHKIVPSAPIVVKNDPTLMFTNAGMNQFKDYFLGNLQAKDTRVADTQKCLRVSGKHNDLEEVGVDTYHHTMFEMLGNWSFGDYFKKEAIAWSWELLTDVYKIDKDRLYVTVFEGDEKEHIPASEIALKEWRKLVPEDRIVYGNKKDNFWEMGDTGPCGPCSEIHVDCRSDEERKLIPGRDLVNKDHPQVIEIWNNVFIQYNRKKDGSLEPLPSTHVDTGMGFERLTRVLQGKSSNYDTDIFSGTIKATEAKVGMQYVAGDDKASVAFRVIADHIRAISFTIADGQLPSNTGAGYVIRRILRRAVRYYYTYLNYKKPLLNDLVPVLAKQFEHVFPELIKQQDFVSKVIKEEEESFLRTLEHGLKKIDEIISQTHNSKVINGAAAFELYDTFGFPIDLTRLIASEHNLTVDEVVFEQELQQQKERSRAASAIDTEDWVIVNDGNESAFIGYDVFESETKILKYRKVKGKGKELFQAVIDVSPFYAESGGQVGDTGTLKGDDGEICQVIDTQKENSLHILLLDKIPSNIEQGFFAKVNLERRKWIEGNHSATHLLHSALKEVLGNHIAQKGSLVNDKQLRFDFSHFSKIEPEDLQRIEEIVNNKITEAIDLIEYRDMPIDEAIALGATALFGEKYGNKVRVIVFDKDYSMELCGGTHVSNTSKIGMFKIVSESSIAAGIRRIEAVTSKGAFELLNLLLTQRNSLTELLGGSGKIEDSIEKLKTENEKIKKQLEQFKQEKVNSESKRLLETQQNISGINCVISKVDLTSADEVKNLCFSLSSKIENLFCVLGFEGEGKPGLSVIISENLVSEKAMDASLIVREIAKEIEGGGGGQKFFASAGGKNVAGLNKALEKARQIVVGSTNS